MTTTEEKIEYAVCIDSDGQVLDTYSTLEDAESAIDSDDLCIAEIKNGEKEYMLNTARGWVSR